jgi:hypothetical protein
MDKQEDVQMKSDEQMVEESVDEVKPRKKKIKKKD